MKKSKLMLGMILINIISMMLGFVRDTSIVYKLGLNSVSDTFIFTINLPTMIFSALGWVISTTFVPIYTDLRYKDSKEKAESFANNFIKIVTIVTTAIYLLLAIFNKTIVNMLVPGFNKEALNLTYTLVPFVLPSIISFGITYCFVGILNSYKKMIWTSAIGIPVNLAVIIGILLVYPKYGLKAAVIATFIGSIIQFLILLPPLKGVGYKYRKGINLKDEQMKEVFKIIAPMIVGVMAQQINSLFSSMIASTLDAGSVTSFNLATKVIYAIYNSFVMIGIVFIFPYLSESIAKNNIEEFRNTIAKGLDLLMVVMVPIMVFLAFFNKEVIKLLFGYGKFSEEAINVTARVLIFLSLGLIFTAVRDLLNRAFYACKNTKTPMKNSIMSIIINILMGLILTKYLGISGLAIASTISMVVTAVLLVIDINKNFEIFKGDKNQIIYVSKYVILGMLLYGFLYLLRQFVFFNHRELMYTVVLGIAGSVFYIISLVVFGFDVKQFLHYLKRKNNK